jgi:hypothetical protein
MNSEVIARAHQELMEMVGFLRAANVQLDKAEAHIYVLGARLAVEAVSA